jgi:hypothetical protein
MDSPPVQLQPWKPGYRKSAITVLQIQFADYDLGVAMEAIYGILLKNGIYGLKHILSFFSTITISHISS